MRLRRTGKRLLSLAAFCLAATAGGALVAGSRLTRSVNGPIGPPPPDLTVENVHFQSASSSEVQGWLLRGRPGAGVIILLHGVRGNRLAMVGHARFLAKAGYSVVLIDFQAHGESQGRRITFGHLESLDVIAAAEFIHRNIPGEKIGIIGSSLGGAAALLASRTLKVDALVLEMVYPTIHDAIANRLEIVLGKPGRILNPLLTMQLRPRLGISAQDLRPIDCAAQSEIPKFFIGGESDRHTTVSDTKRLYEAATSRKQMWIVSGAGHGDLHAKAPADYERRVLAFLKECLGTAGQ